MKKFDENVKEINGKKNQLIKNIHYLNDKISMYFDQIKQNVNFYELAISK